MKREEFINRRRSIEEAIANQSKCAAKVLWNEEDDAIFFSLFTWGGITRYTAQTQRECCTSILLRIIGKIKLGNSEEEMVSTHAMNLVLSLGL